MPTITVAEIIERARELADQTDEQFVTPATALRWLNQARYKLALLAARSSYVLEQTRTELTLDGSNSYTLPRPIALVSVHLLTESNTLKRLRPVHLGQVYAVNASREQSSTVPCEYYVEVSGSNMLLYPNPRSTSGKLVITTIPEPAQVTLADSVTYANGVEDWIVLDTAIRMALKEEGETRDLMRQRKEVEEFVESLGWSAHFMDPPAWRSQEAEDLEEDPRQYPWRVF